VVAAFATGADFAPVVAAFATGADFAPVVATFATGADFAPVVATFTTGADFAPVVATATDAAFASAAVFMELSMDPPAVFPFAAFVPDMVGVRHVFRSEIS
jgi:hypothetical protein